MEDNSLKITIGVILGSVILIVGVVGFISMVEKPDIVDVQEIVRESGNVKGAQDSGIVVVEFSDFLCPACKVAAGEIQRFMDDYPDQVKFIFRHMPLPQHQNAKFAAFAAEAAGKQEKFWQVHDWLFENQDMWEEAQVTGEYFFEQFGEKFELEKDKFVQDYKSDEIRGLVTQDLDDAAQFGINSTPTFFINGKKQTGVLAYDKLVELTNVQSISPSPQLTSEVEPSE